MIDGRISYIVRKMNLEKRRKWVVATACEDVGANRQ